MQTLLSGLPYYTGGRRRADGRLDEAGAPLTLEQFVRAFGSWVVDYNNRSHSELGGQTPLEAFASDPTPLRTICPEDARALLTARKTARVRRDGVSHNAHMFIAAELHDLVGEEVELAFAPHDDREVEVYWRGDWLCTAYPQDTLSVAQQQLIVSERRAYAAELRRRQRRAARDGRSRLAPLTASQPTPAETIVLDEKALNSRRTRHAGEATLRANARMDLLAPPGPPRVRSDAG